MFVDFGVDIHGFEGIKQTFFADEQYSTLRLLPLKRLNDYQDKNSTKVFFYNNGWEDMHPKLLKHEFNKDTKIILDRSFETGLTPTPGIMSIINYFKSFNIPNENIILISNRASQNLKFDFDIDYPHIFVDYWALDCVDRVEKKTHIPNTVNYTDRPKKIGYMCSKIFKEPRLELLRELVSKTHLSKLLLSVTHNDYEYEELVKLNCDQKLLSVVRSNKGPYDFKENLYSVSGNQTAAKPWPCDSKFYTYSGVTIGTETFAYTKYTPMISEKTYRPIMNLHPYIMIMQDEYKDYLENLGLDTYRKIVGNYKDADVEQAVSAAKEFLYLPPKISKKVEQISIKNKERLINYAHGEAQRFQQLMVKHLTK